MIASIMLIVISTINIQLQGQFVSISLRPVLGTVAATSWLRSGHYVVNIFHLVGVLD